MTLADARTLQHALWRSQGWRRQAINLDAAAVEVAEALASQVGVELLGRGVPVSDFSLVEERIRTRVREVLDRVVSNLEQEGFAVVGVEGSIERAMASLIVTIGSPEGTKGEGV